MNSNLKRRWGIFQYYWFGWTAAFVFLSIVRGVGTEELGYIKFDLFSSMLISVTMGPFVGVISALVDIVLDEYIYKRLSIARWLVIRLFFGIGFLIFLILLAYGVYKFYYGLDLDIITFAFDEGSFAIYFYVICIDLLLNAIRQVNMLLGEGKLLKLFTGAFYTPKEERRVFMFLDLQSSTELAERLGHVVYSSLIQDCFNDLRVVAEYDAEVYQYVGDEAVLTWEYKDGIRNQNCLRAFFRFKAQLAKRQSYYQKQYHCIPFFKAGVHFGKVMVTEVGKYKREIAYHGDPVNTAARIQSQCNVHGEELLISHALKEVIELSAFQLRKVGDILLRGKQDTVAIYAVST